MSTTFAISKELLEEFVSCLEYSDPNNILGTVKELLKSPCNAPVSVTARTLLRKAESSLEIFVSENDKYTQGLIEQIAAYLDKEPAK